MGGPDMAPQVLQAKGATPPSGSPGQMFGAPGMNPGAPLSPSPHTLGAPRRSRGTPRYLRQAPYPRRAGGRVDLTRPRQRSFMAPTRGVPMRSDRGLSALDFHTARIGMRLLTTPLWRLPGATLAEKRRWFQE